MGRVYVPATGVDDWKRLLADSEKQWRSGYSARTLACSWQDADGFPAEVQQSMAELYGGIEVLLVLPEHRVALPGGSRPSQSDVWVLARVGDGLVSIAVEGKVAEPFGPTVTEWQNDPSAGKTSRLEFLRAELGMDDPIPGHVRYQLLHRAASAVIEAKRFGARHACLLVHSFSQSDEWFDDFRTFVELLGGKALPNSVTPVGNRGGVSLSAGWVRGDAAYLSR